MKALPHILNYYSLNKEKYTVLHSTFYSLYHQHFDYAIYLDIQTYLFIFENCISLNLLVYNKIVCLLCIHSNSTLRVGPCFHVCYNKGNFVIFISHFM